MPESKPRMGKAGVAWLLLIATPPTIILTGLVAVFVWQISKGQVTPKWRKKAPPSAAVTNQAGIASPDPIPAAGRSPTSETAPR